jgi:hypothetical protein
MPRVAGLVAAALALLATEVGGAPLGAAATRAEASTWLERLGAAGADVGVPLAWRYSFSAATTERLEALSLELVRAGYAIESLAPARGGGAARLDVTRVELLTPAAVGTRSGELAALARRHRARYVGLDLAAAAAIR